MVEAPWPEIPATPEEETGGQLTFGVLWNLLLEIGFSLQAHFAAGTHLQSLRNVSYWKVSVQETGELYVEFDLFSYINVHCELILESVSLITIINNYHFE